MPDVLRLCMERMETPIGELLLVAEDGGRLRAVDWAGYEERMLRLLRLHYGKKGFTVEPVDQLDAVRQVMKRYFDGDLKALDEIDVKTAGTPFQRAVWSELRQIRCGSAISYGSLAARIHCPKAVRAVGLANGANPISIVVPCHRVIGANGSLTGYGGGLERKRWLLEHERKHTGGADSRSVAQQRRP